MFSASLRQMWLIWKSNRRNISFIRSNAKYVPASDPGGLPTLSLVSKIVFIRKYSRIYFSTAIHESQIHR